MADWATFILKYDEFAGYDATAGAAMLADSVAQINAAVWGTLADQGVYLLTAQRLAKKPGGNTAKLVNKDGTTVYDDELDRLRADVVGGNRST